MYAKQAFFEAVSSLATSPDRIQTRLAYAGLKLSKLYRPKEDLPPEHLEEFLALMQELTSQPAIGDGSPIQATTSKLTDEQCKKLAERILSIYTDIMGGLA